MTFHEDLHTSDASGLSFWSRSLAGSAVAFALLVGLGRVIEALLLSFDAVPDHVAGLSLATASTVALAAGGWAAARLAGTNPPRPVLTALVVWATLALVLMQLDGAGIQLDGAGAMFGEGIEDSALMPFSR